MMFKKKYYPVLLIVAVGLFPCNGIPDSVQVVDLSEVVQKVIPQDGFVFLKKA